MSRTVSYIGKDVGLSEPHTISLELPEGGFRLEHGGVLREISVTYEMCGALSEKKDNVVFICHALTGDSHVAGIRPGAEKPDGWWEGMVGSGRGIDTDRYCVVCANILGGCQGTTGPSSTNPQTGKPYGSSFPQITIRDIVRVHILLLKSLGIERAFAVVGGSFGGMQVLEWAVSAPETVENAIVIASSAALSTQALAFDIIGRKAITRDPAWKEGDYYLTDGGPVSGLSQARRIAHVTYLSDDLMREKFGRNHQQEWISAGEEALARARRDFRTTFQVESYLDHQARKFIERFDANSYLHITRAMDEFDLAASHGSLRQAFSRIAAKVLLVSLSGDWLFTPSQSQDMLHTLLGLGKDVTYFALEAPEGHDAFLTHIGQLQYVIKAFLANGRPFERPADKLEPAKEKAYNAISGLIEKGERVLDIGCARGRLLRLLRERNGVTGVGIDIDYDALLEALGRGNSVVLDDMTTGKGSKTEESFFLVPDNSFDTVVLSDSLQVMKRPLKVLQEGLRIARSVIVTFPNFGYLTTRSQLFFKGHMPVDSHLPLEWYETPNIHLFTLRDFLRLCDENGFVVQRVVSKSESLIGRLLTHIGKANLGAEQLIVKIVRPETAGKAAPPAGGTEGTTDGKMA